MNILLLTQVLPYPPDSGPKVKTLNVIKYLAQRHTVWLVSFVRGDQRAEAEALRAYCKEVICVPLGRPLWADALALVRSLVTGQPWVIARDDRANFRRAVKALSARQSFDIVQADQTNMAQFAYAVRARRVVDTHNALWLLYQRMAGTLPAGPKKWLFARDWRLLRRYEAQLCRDFDAVTAVSEEDRAALVAVGADEKKIAVIPITVDAEAQAVVEREPDACHILHIGTMYWPPNIDGVLWFLREIFPLVRREMPQVQFDVVGARPPAEIVALGGPGSGVNVTGYVDDTLPYMRRAGVLIAPLRAGGGMRVKILNAMVHGLPVVSTRIGAEGIAAMDGQHLLLADTPDDFARTVVSLLRNPARAQQLGRNGRALIESTYDYRVACAAYERVYR